MDNSKGTKINRLLQVWPQGTVATAVWLKERGISPLLNRRYQETGWLDSFGYGAAIRKGDKVEWPGALFSLQTQLHLPIHVGGKSALELQGYAHFIKFGQLGVHLYHQRGRKLPVWFTNATWEEKVHIHTTNLLPASTGCVFYEEKNFSIQISGPERAFFEMLYLVPQAQDLQECYYLLENMIDLRPAVLQTLLEQLTSVKVKRLFLFLADKVHHPWLDQLDCTRIALGSGNRQIVANGVLDKKYLITVPPELAND